MLERTDLDNACVVNQDVNLAEPGEGLLNRGLNLGAVEQVTLDGQNLGLESVEVGLRAGELFRIARENRHATTLFAKLAGNLQAETARSAGDQCNFATKEESASKHRNDVDFSRADD